LFPQRRTKQQQEGRKGENIFFFESQQRIQVVAMATSLILTTILPVLGTVLAEHFVLQEKFSPFYATSKFLVPKGFAAVVFVNVVLTSVTLVVLGFKVASARTTIKAKALKDGDKDAEARYSYPKLYAEGFDVHAKNFNCVQRGHQQALETYTAFVALSLVGGVKFPLTVTLAGLIWNIARYKWAEGYATGEPGNRYSNWISKGIWSGLMMVLAAAVGTALHIAEII